MAVEDGRVYRRESARNGFDGAFKKKYRLCRNKTIEQRNVEDAAKCDVAVVCDDDVIANGAELVFERRAAHEVQAAESQGAGAESWFANRACFTNQVSLEVSGAEE